MKLKDLVEKHGDLELSEEVLKQLGIEVKVDKFEEPKTGELCFFVDSDGDVVVDSYDATSNNDKAYFNTGNCYPKKHFTKEEVEEITRQKLEYDKAVWELKREIARLNDGWVPNWEDKTEQKYGVYIEHGEFGRIYWNKYKLMPNWVYLKSQDLCEQLIKTHEKQLKIYLEIE